jgi:hypothetical protein
MLHSARNELRSPRLLAGRPRPGVPSTVFDTETPLRTLGLALGPFLAVYSLWGMVDERVHALFRVNAQAFGLAPEEWSVSFARWPAYAGIAVVALVLRIGLNAVLVRAGQRWLRVPVVLCEGTWVFSSFFVLGRLIGPVWTWLTSRAFWVGTENAWYQFAAGLPNWRLPFGTWTLPHTVQEGWGWFWAAFLPGLSLSILLPLVWLALAAVVHGWREFRAMDLLTGTPARRGIRPSLPRWADWLTADLRGKYLPVASSLRLILAAGPRFVGAYLILATVLRIGEQWLAWLFAVTAGVRPVSVGLALSYLWDLIAGFLAMTLLAALYLAAFDRGITETAAVRHTQPAQDLSSMTPSGVVSRTNTDSAY